MAVYTYLNKKDIQEITKAFNLGKLIKYNGIKAVSYTHLTLPTTSSV